MSVMKSAVRIAKDIFHSLGLEISRYRPETHAPEENPLGTSYLSDIKRLTRSHPVVVFDVGANKGQSVIKFKNLLRDCEIHSFEPGPETYKILLENAGALRGVHLNNVAVGSSCTSKTFFENKYSDMSSFLKPGEICWGEVVGETEVPVITLDGYCADKNISHISVLKTDTQGYDFEVLKGAEGLLKNNRIELLLLEVIFSELYENLPQFDEVYRFLMDRGFKLVSFYQFGYHEQIAAGSDALFINTSFDYGGTNSSNTPPVHK